jgi:hypothetical protein
MLFLQNDGNSGTDYTRSITSQQMVILMDKRQTELEVVSSPQRGCSIVHTVSSVPGDGISSWKKIIQDCSLSDKQKKVNII